MDDPEITHTVHIQAPRSHVWDALTQPELVAQWFGDDAQFALTPGAVGSLTFEGYGTFRIVIEEIDAPAVFGFRWARTADTDPTDGHATRVRFTLDDEDGGTRVTVVEDGWASLDDSYDVTAAMKDNLDGWVQELDELRADLEKQDSQ
ncbi:SRPBCC domain-containing protein [Glaciihabitans sp. dw_435]|uniref:SRPBCC domain-containing protein n=1 Tax=Glaciihabitans sp. dw_435 TaxID=2720081 RepID=UPI001BD5A752|nr:SRPBCC domain-containing protein [Glaciihabitans sp. dw_435]